MIQFLKTYWRSSVWLAFITLACLVKKVPVEQPKFDLIGFDKLAHFVFYLVLSSLIFFEGYRKTLTSISWFWVLAFPIAYGGLIELIQMAMVSPRSAEWGDFLADALGSLLVWFVLIPLYRKYFRS